MALLDSSELEKRISELEQRVGELEKGLLNHKVVIDSLMRSIDSLGNQLRELREELWGRGVLPKI